MGINVDEGVRPSDNMDRDGQEKHPVSPKSPMSLPASMELSPKSSMLSLPAAVELEIVTEAASIAELLERDAAQRDAEAPGASIVIVGGAGVALLHGAWELAWGGCAGGGAGGRPQPPGYRARG